MDRAPMPLREHGLRFDLEQQTRRPKARIAAIAAGASA